MKKEIELFLNSTHDGVIAIDENAIITIFNRAAQKLTKINKKNAIGRNIEEVIESTRLPIVLETGKSELNQLQPLNEIEIITNRKPVYDDNKNIIGAIAVFRDVTEVKTLLDKITNLKEIQSTLEAIINSTQDAISVVDENGYGMMINPAYTRLTGYTSEDIIGEFCTKDLASGESVHLKVLETKKPVKAVELIVGPQEKKVIANAAPIIVNDELKGSVAVIHDLSEINELMKDLNNAKTIIRSLEAKYTFKDIIGENIKFKKIIKKAKAASTTPATIILRGESGVGKELFAHAIHNNSKRSNNQFVRVNCAALSDNLLESELFGYEPGAFTGARKKGKVGLFEKADKGTIFLDEIGEIDKKIQVKLLRVLQEREILRVGGNKPISVDVRIISATNKNLEKEVENNNFRRDLYYRLNVVPINIIPLREHIDDLNLLIHYLIIKYNQKYGRSIESITSNAVNEMKKYSWPGNVRELENFIGRTIINMKFSDKIIKKDHLPVFEKLTKDTQNINENVNIEDKNYSSLKNATNDFEKEYIKKILKENNLNRAQTAKVLDISERSLYYKINKYNLKT